jgi:uncharacterized ParB-like nuclease family protein
MFCQYVLRAATVLAFTATIAAEDVSKDRNTIARAMVMVGDGCSGVNIYGSGLILTAGHCEPGVLEKITFEGGGVYMARRIYAPGNGRGEGCVALKIAGEYKDLPFIPVSRALDHKLGEQCLSGGYPQSPNGRPLLIESQTITRSDIELGYVDRSGPINKFKGLATKPRAPRNWSGNSGGPLLANEGDGYRVAGILSSGDPGMLLWINRREIEYSVLNAAKRHMVVFTRDDCLPCQRFKAYEKRAKHDVHITYVRYDPNSDTWSDPGWVSKFEETTGRKINSVPTYWIPGQKQYQTKGLPQDVLSWAVKIINLLIEPIKAIIGGRQDAVVTEQIQPRPDPIGGSMPIEPSESLKDDRKVDALQRTVEGLQAALDRYREADAKGNLEVMDVLKKTGADLVQQNADLIEEKLGPKGAYIASAVADRAASGEEFSWSFIATTILGVLFGGERMHASRRRKKVAIETEEKQAKGVAETLDKIINKTQAS